MTPNLFACNWPKGETRSPNRHPRWRIRMRQDTLSAKKDSFLAHLRAGAKRREAAEKARLTESAVGNMIQEQPNFRAQVLDAEAEAVRVATGTLVGALPRAAERFVGGVDSAEERIALDTAYKLLKGRGVLVEAGAHVQVNVGIQQEKEQVLVILQNPEVREMALRLEKMLAKEAE